MKFPCLLHAPSDPLNLVALPRLHSNPTSQNCFIILKFAAFPITAPAWMLPRKIWVVHARQPSQERSGSGKRDMQ